jgi:hypothetical protein
MLDISGRYDKKLKNNVGVGAYMQFGNFYNFFYFNRAHPCP